MRACIFILLIVSAVFAQIPKPIGFVNDFANVIDDSNEYVIALTLESLEKDKGVEIAIATISTLPVGETVQTYANKLLNEWGVGKRGEDNGLLILISVQERRIQVETGYGLEGILPDGRIGRILDNHIDQLSAGNYGTAIEGIAGEFSGIIRNEYVAGARQKSFVVEIFPYIVFGFIVFLIIVALAYNYFGNRCPKCRAKLKKQTVSETKTQTKIKIYCLQCGYHKYITQAAGAAAMGMGARGGGRSGGGGGFGGGRSGGGGAGRGF